MINSKFKISKREFERMGFSYIGRSHLMGEHYNFYGTNKRGEPQFILNYNRKTGGVTLTKCLDELTIDGLLSKVQMTARRTSAIDIFGYIITAALMALCAVALLKVCGYNPFNL
tara:strand:+ start:14032 stop:14373 length:342 start_codon:yes stop_codon:yes gene_type:complete